MTGSIPWYAGRCVRRHDVIAHIEIISRRTEDGWALVENAQKLFPRSGEVEVRGVDTRSLRSGEWVALQIASRERMGRGLWKAARHRRLAHFADLSHLGSLDDARKVLAIDGLQTSEPSGAWIIRIRDSEVVQMDLVRYGEGGLIASSTSKVLAYVFDPTAVVQMPNGVARVALYDLGQDASPSTAYDWSPEDNYVARIVRSLAGAHDPRIADVIAWLERHADEVTGRLSLNGADLAAAYEALRSGELAKRLAADQELLRAFAIALGSAPKIKGLIEAEIAMIAAEERGAIRACAQLELAEEIQDSRRERLSALDAELRTREDEARTELERLLAAQLAAVDETLAERREKGSAEINRSIGLQRAALDSTVAELTQVRDTLAEEVRELEPMVRELSTELASLRESEAEAAVNLDRLLAAATTTGALPKGNSAESLVPIPAPSRSRIVAASDMWQAIRRCALLTDAGRTLMEQFLALTLAGDVPILTGPEVADFLLIAESMLSSGASARLVADPTVLSFEDLWMRAGLGVLTPLGQALKLTGGDNPVTLVAVIEKAEQSGSRFWFPALADRARRGGLPRRLLICTTVEDETCEEAKVLLSQGVSLDMRSVINEGAAAIAALALSESEHREFDPGEWMTDVTEGMRATATIADRLDIARGIRAARAAAEASRLAPVDESQAHSLAIANLFVKKSAGDRPALSILQQGKSSA
ncbi:hypothetical protein [Cupriavidus sp. D39]|uniref:hypothetical protein n=1 Tax=Cupriavidus sp. D39 TaxID=2997877 RepID=UPI0022711332|nr:hypothetical protein [Cupriavidus sp. D39]MCY0856858.1 hypothetical protein [Cupriavidus sp. D39]